MKLNWQVILGLILATIVAHTSYADDEQPIEAPQTIETPQTAPMEQVLTVPPPKPEIFATLAEKASYVIGVNIGRSMKNDELDINLDILMKGMTDAYVDDISLLDEEQIQMVMTEFTQMLTEKRQVKQNRLAEANAAAGAALLQTNMTKEDITILDSGLQYKILKSGQGPSPTADDMVKVHYHGTLVDGTVFDSSVERGEPVTFPVKAVIPGWVEALQLMKVGDKWKLFIPGDLAYGEMSRGDKIGPNATLIFEIELLEITQPPAPPEINQAETPESTEPADNAEND